jgi:hypothetical protein
VQTQRLTSCYDGFGLEFELFVACFPYFYEIQVCVANGGRSVGIVRSRTQAMEFQKYLLCFV